MTSNSNIRGTRLAKNSVVNLAGNGLPMLVAVLTIPHVIAQLGPERFGILALVWAIVGYFGLFDVGVGRATTKFVADFNAARQLDDAAKTFWTSMYLLFVLGAASGFVLLGITSLLVSSVFNISEHFVRETEVAFYWLAASLPCVLASASPRGVLEARQQFIKANLLKIPLSVINYVSPLLVLPFTNNISTIVAVLAIARMLAFIVYVLAVLSPLDRSCMRPDLYTTKRLLTFGSWLTVSSVVGPIMVYLDRFLIGAVLTMSSVAYYVTPYELVTKLLVVSGSVMGVMFPAFSALNASDDQSLSAAIDRTERYTALLMAPLVIAIIMFAKPLLYLWVGRDFAENSALVLQFLAIGVFVTSIGSVPYTVLQAIGRPDVTAKIHLVELPIYLVMIMTLPLIMGLTGVALSWTVRSLGDALIMSWSARRHTSARLGNEQESPVRMLIFVGGVLVTAYVLASFESMTFKISAYLTAVSVMAILSWKFWMLPPDRQFLRQLVKST